MAVTVINSFRVEDFQKWKQGFESGKSVRDNMGLKVTGTYQSVDDSNNITVICELPDVEAAKKMRTLPELQEAWKRSGVIISSVDTRIMNQLP